MVNIKLDGKGKLYHSLHYGSIQQSHFTQQLLPKGEALLVYVWDFRKWKIFPNSKTKYLYHKAIKSKAASLLEK